MRFWTDENTAAAKALWMAGKSASQVANAIGAPSRNAVIGRVYRMGWKRSETINEANRESARVRGMMLAAERSYKARGQIKPKSRKASYKPRRAFNPLKLPTVSLVAYERPDRDDSETIDLTPLREAKVKVRRWAEHMDTPGVPVGEIQPHHCRWPLGAFNAVSTHFCGAQRGDGSYCPGHAYEAHNKTAGPPRRFVVGRAA